MKEGMGQSSVRASALKSHSEKNPVFSLEVSLTLIVIEQVHIGMAEWLKMYNVSDKGKV